MASRHLPSLNMSPDAYPPPHMDANRASKNSVGARQPRAWTCGASRQIMRRWVYFIDRSKQMATARIGGLRTQKHRSELEMEPTFLWLSGGMERHSTMCLSPSHRLVHRFQADQVEERLQGLEDRKHVPSFTIILYISSFVNAVVPRANL